MMLKQMQTRWDLLTDSAGIADLRIGIVIINGRRLLL